jgi:hypothetical protein
VLYACDNAWWRLNDGLPEFRGLKLTADGQAAAAFSDLHKVHLCPGLDRLTAERPGHIGDGGNSGFQAVNLALQFGATRMVLVGFDMRRDRGLHWHGPHRIGLNNPSERNLIRWRAALESAAAQLPGFGVRTFNASKVSTLTGFPKVSLAKALA